MLLLNDQLRTISLHELDKMTMIDFVEMFKYLSKYLQEKRLKLSKEHYNQIKHSFIKEAQKSWAKTDQHSHSLTYFLFLSVK